VIDATSHEEAFEMPEIYLREIGDAGITLSCAPCTVLATMLMSRVLDPELLFCGLLDGDKELLQLIETWHRKNVEVYEIAARSPLMLFTDGGSTSNGMLSPGIFREYCLPQLQEYSDILHRSGKLKVTHAVGESFKGILHDLPESGIDALMGFRTETAGNVTMQEVRDAWQGSVCLVGGIDSDYLCRLRGDDFKARAEQFVRQLRREDRIVLSTNSATMPGTPPENFRMVTELMRQHLWK